jgi:hypothetical protein
MKLDLRSLYPLLVLSAATLLSFTLEGCGIERPGVKDASRMFASFKHSGTEASCVACHEAQRPIPVANVAHGNGGDCVECHQAGVGWLAGVTAFNHSPLPTSCSACHVSKRPTVLIHSFSHAIHGTGDCVSCHTANPANAGITWAGGVYDHRDARGLMVSSCTECHAQRRPTALVNGFNHQTASVLAQDCATCHRNPGVNWAGGQFTHSPVPTSCNSCHAGSRPAPTTLLPAGGVANLFVHSARFQGDGDCATCHLAKPANLGVTFAGGTFNHQELNSATGSLQGVTTCTTCHEVQRPTNHATLGYTGDCVSCHNTASYVGVSWAGAQGKPHGSSGSTSGSTLNCASCHGQTGTATHKLSIATSAHMGGTSNACTACHIDFSGFSGSRTVLQYGHATATAPVNDCKTCHTFTGGSMHSYTDATWTLSQTTTVTSSVSGTTISRNHTVTTADQNMSNCTACHKYQAYSASTSTPALRWKFTHRPTNPGVTNTTRSLGCAVCH